MGFSDEPLVSIDYNGDSRSSIVDGLSTMKIGDNLIKIIAWYDNEWGYSVRCVDLAKFINEKKENNIAITKVYLIDLQ